MGWALHSSDNELEMGKNIKSDVRVYDPKNMESEKFEPVYTVKQNGNILISESSKDKYIINEFNPAGILVRKIHKQYIKKKRDPEYVKEVNRLNLSKASSHSSSKNRYKFKEFSEFKTVINQIFTDKDDNIWVSVEESDINQNYQIFDVFNIKGIFLNRFNIPELKGMLLKSSWNKIVAVTSEDYEITSDTDFVIKIVNLKII